MWKVVERLLALAGSVFTIIGAIAAVIAVLPEHWKKGTVLETAQISIANTVAPNGYKLTTSEIPPPAQPPTDPPCDRDPNTVTMADIQTPYFMNGDVIALEGCFGVGALVACKFVITRGRDGDAHYYYRGPLPWAGTLDSIMIDTDKVAHNQIRGYFLNGKCESKDDIFMSKGQHVWFFQEFAGPVTGVTPNLVTINPTRINEPAFHVTLKARRP